MLFHLKQTTYAHSNCALARSFSLANDNFAYTIFLNVRNEQKAQRLRDALRVTAIEPTITSLLRSDTVLDNTVVKLSSVVPCRV